MILILFTFFSFAILINFSHPLQIKLYAYLLALKYYEFVPFQNLLWSFIIHKFCINLNFGFKNFFASILVHRIRRGKPIPNRRTTSWHKFFFFQLLLAVERNITRKMTKVVFKPNCKWSSIPFWGLKEKENCIVSQFISKKTSEMSNTVRKHQSRHWMGKR